MGTNPFHTYGAAAAEALVNNKFGIVRSSVLMGVGAGAVTLSALDRLKNHRRDKEKSDIHNPHFGNTLLEMGGVAAIAIGAHNFTGAAKEAEETAWKARVSNSEKEAGNFREKERAERAERQAKSDAHWKNVKDKFGPEGQKAWEESWEKVHGSKFEDRYKQNWERSTKSSSSESSDSEYNKAVKKARDYKEKGHSYGDLAKKYHPDKNPEHSDGLMMKAINEVYTKADRKSANKTSWKKEKYSPKSTKDSSAKLLSSSKPIESIVTSSEELASKVSEPLNDFRSRLDRFDLDKGSFFKDKETLAQHLGDHIGNMNSPGLRLAAAQIQGRDISDYLSDQNIMKRGEGFIDKNSKVAHNYEFLDKNHTELVEQLREAKDIARQEFIKNHGESTTLYRGINGKEAKRIREALSKGEKPLYHPTGLESWTDDPKVAEGFTEDLEAGPWGKELREGGEPGLILKKTIHSDEIFGSHNDILTSLHQIKREGFARNEYLVGSKGDSFEINPESILGDQGV